jgi:hypothetical protein
MLDAYGGDGAYADAILQEARKESLGIDCGAAPSSINATNGTTSCGSEEGASVGATLW